MRATAPIRFLSSGFCPLELRPGDDPDHPVLDLHEVAAPTFRRVVIKRVVYDVALPVAELPVVNFQWPGANRNEVTVDLADGGAVARVNEVGRRVRSLGKDEDMPGGVDGWSPEATSPGEEGRSARQCVCP